MYYQTINTDKTRFNHVLQPFINAINKLLVGQKTQPHIIYARQIRNSLK